MVTLAYFILTVLLTLLIAFFDTRIFEYSYVEALRNLFFTEIAAGKYIVFAGLLVGLMISMIIDVRIFLSKKNIKTNGNQA
ncbi:hypothetical protein [Neobacillus mesonae]|uniref:hypothetical protein n=1 Tax=Neobacillus mesonae TaxID=1193713 RepID=UPI000831D9E7|nr:hypothetical protein [Neobacillus mesonae]MED4203446.1 hypothetical protein [Neobacillus mesonae]